MNDLAKNLMLWAVVAVVLMVVFQSFSPKTGGSDMSGSGGFPAPRGMSPKCFSINRCASPESKSPAIESTALFGA